MALHSDHVNYLIFRYLQESGLEQTASSLHQEWQRPYDFRDPETLPFASKVQRGELISVLQHGLWHDELQAQVLARKGRGGRRQFRWMGANPRPPSIDGQMLENGASRPSSSEKQHRRKQRRPVQPSQSGMRAPDEFPTPPPKRARRSEGSEGAQLNGESMDVDTALSPSLADAEGEDDPDLASPLDETTTEVVEVPERYDSMDVATQTEVKVGTKTSTTYWSVGKAAASILQNTWSPRNNDLLLTVGERLCRVHWVKSENEEKQTDVTQEDLTDLPPHAVVTAATWRPGGNTAMCAIDCAPTEGQPVMQQMLLEWHSKGGNSTSTPSTSLLEPAGIVIRMQYSSPNGDFLLVLRNNLKRGLVQIWDTRQKRSPPQSSSPMAEHEETAGQSEEPTPPTSAEPIAYQIFDRQVFDVCWTGRDTFVVVGEDGLASVHAVVTDDRFRSIPLTPTSLTADTVLSQGLREIDGSLTRAVPALDRITWTKVAACHYTGTIALASSPEMRKLAVVVQEQPGLEFRGTAVFDLPSPLTDLAFRTEIIPHNTPSGTYRESLLAVAFEGGFCTLYDIVFREGGIDDNEPLVFDERATLQFSQPAEESPTESKGAADPALALCWSPEEGGSHLAVAGTDVVRVWDVRPALLATPSIREQQREGSDSIKKSGQPPQPVVEWRFEPPAAVRGAGGVDDEGDGGEGEGEQVLSEPSLSWSADGGRLGFSSGGVVAVITFRPKLSLHVNTLLEEYYRARDPGNQAEKTLQGGSGVEHSPDSVQQAVGVPVDG